jgi:hypothetical protein
MDLNSALDGMTRKQLQELADKAAKRLRSCALCGGEHPEPYTIRKANHLPGQRRGAILLCAACFAKVREPESKAAEA